MTRKTVAYKGYADATRRFDIEPSPGRERNRFGYRFRRFITFNAGDLVPFFCKPCLPGDDFVFEPKFLVRLSNALVSPLMDEITCNVYFFLTYNRFVFDDWNAFMGEFVQQNPDYDESGQNKGGDSLTVPPFNTPEQYELPTLKIPADTSTTAAQDSTAFGIQTLYDYFALPYKVKNNGYEIQTLKLRHYNHIYNEYFRNENLQDFAPVPKSIGPDKIGQYKVLPVTKYPDYFTGSLPFLQKGPNVSIGLTGDVPVIGNGLTLGLTNGTISSGIQRVASTTGPFTASLNTLGLPYDNTSRATALGESAVGLYGVVSDPSKSGLKATLDPATAVTLAQIRLGFQLQRFYEGQARSGTRYIEYINFMFDEYIPDVQLQRPKFIGGLKFDLNINPVTQTSNNENEMSPLGTLAAFGVAYNGTGHIHTHCNEHGYIMGLICARTPLSYQQGLDRDWSYRDRFDFYTPTLAHLAEQPIKNKELCCTGIAAYDEGVFGYIGRYDEYRTMMTEITGYFRSNAPGTLQSYHLGEFWDTSNPGTEADGFPGLPHLNANFIRQPKNVIDRVMNISSEAPNVPQFLCNVVMPVRGVRVVSKYGIPGFADHF